jgi:hypothetical protein
MIAVLLVVLAAAVGALSGGSSVVLLRCSRRTPIADATLGAVGFVLSMYAQLHWMSAAFMLVPLSLKSLLGAVVSPVAHQAIRSRW